MERIDQLAFGGVTGFGVRLYWPSYDEATPSRRPVTLSWSKFDCRPATQSKTHLFIDRTNNIPAVGTGRLSCPAATHLTTTWFAGRCPAAQQLSEAQNLLGLDGKTWALVVEVTPERSSSSAGLPPAHTPSFDSTDFQFSGRHNGLFLYLGLILGPADGLTPLARHVGKSQLLGQLNLASAEGFVHANVYHQTGPYQTNEKGRLQVVAFTKIIPAQSTNLNFAKQEAQMQERKSLLAMKQLLDHSVEVLGL